MQPLTMSFCPARFFEPARLMRLEDGLDRFLLRRVDEGAGVHDEHVGLVRVAVISIPRPSTPPSMISASTRFFAQPRRDHADFAFGGRGRRHGGAIYSADRPPAQRSTSTGAPLRLLWRDDAVGSRSPRRWRMDRAHRRCARRRRGRRRVWTMHRPRGSLAIARCTLCRPSRRNGRTCCRPHRARLWPSKRSANCADRCPRGIRRGSSGRRRRCRERRRRRCSDSGRWPFPTRRGCRRRRSRDWSRSARRRRSWRSRACSSRPLYSCRHSPRRHSSGSTSRRLCPLSDRAGADAIDT